jgi:hypothetical protein
MIRTFAWTLLLLLAQRTAHAQTFSVQGTMKHTNVETGCWYLAGDDGKSYEPVGDTTLIAGLHNEGQHVSLLVEPAKGMASTCMIGQLVRVVDRLDLRRSPVDPPIMTMEVKGTVHRTKRKTWYVQTASGTRYEFREPFASKYHHIGAPMNAKVRVLLDQKSTKERMDGVILPDSPKTNKGNIEKKYDTR